VSKKKKGGVVESTVHTSGTPILCYPVGILDESSAISRCSGSGKRASIIQKKEGEDT